MLGLKKVLLLFLGTLLFGGTLCSVASAAPRRERITVFSNLCMHPETGDILGDRVIVLSFPEGAYVLYQDGEGEVVSSVGKISDLSKERIKFSMLLYADEFVFEGSIRKNRLSGRFTKKSDQKYSREISGVPMISSGDMKIRACR